jgi:hypothetical protein
MDQGEQIPVILAQQRFEMLAILCSHCAFVFGHRTRLGEGLVYLPIQVLPVRYDQECPVPRHFPQHLLREEQHRKALAAALRVPEDAQPALISANLLHGFDGAIRTQFPKGFLKGTSIGGEMEWFWTFIEKKEKKPRAKAKKADTAVEEKKE